MKGRTKNVTSTVQERSGNGQHPACDGAGPNFDAVNSTAALLITHRPERHHLPHYRLMPPGQNDASGRFRDDADDHHLLKDEREVPGGQETIALRREDAGEQQGENEKGGEHPVTSCPSIEAEGRIPAVHACHRLVGMGHARDPPDTFLPVFAYSTAASTPSAAIFK